MKFLEKFILIFSFILLLHAQFSFAGVKVLTQLKKEPTKIMVLGTTAIAQKHLVEIARLEKEGEYNLIGIITRRPRTNDDPEIKKISEILGRNPIIFSTSKTNDQSTLEEPQQILSNLKEVIRTQKPDLLLNAGSSESHYGVLMAAIEEGCAVLSEKPFTFLQEQSQAVINQAKFKKVFVTDGLMNMHSNWWGELKNVLREIAVPLLQVEATYDANIIKYTNKKESRGSIYNLGVYPLSGVLRVANIYKEIKELESSQIIPRIQSIHGTIDPVVNYGSNDPEEASVEFEFTSGNHTPILLKVTTNSAAPKKENWMKLRFRNETTLTISNPFLADASEVSLTLTDCNGIILGSKIFNYTTTAYYRQLKDIRDWLNAGLTEPPIDSGLQFDDTIKLIHHTKFWYNTAKS